MYEFKFKNKTINFIYYIIVVNKIQGVIKLANNYDDNSIRSLKGAERVRKRPGVMFGSDDIKGAFHTLKEIVGNSTDEGRAGFGNLIEITYHKDGSISVRDYGRGVPMGWNEREERYNWDLIFNELYAGGKYDEDSETYKFSVGLNGLGAASTQYTSEWFTVESYKEDKVYRKEFKKGYPVDGDMEERPNDTGKTGTFIHWKVDNEVFPDTNFTFKMFKDYCEGQAHINSIDFKVLDEHTGEEVYIEGEGIEKYLVNQLGENVIDVFYSKKANKGVERGANFSTECEVVLAITEECKSKYMYFHNTANIDTGVHVTAVQDAVNKFFKAIGKQNGVSIQPYDYNDYLSVLVSSYSNITSYANQTKTGVSNQFIYDIIYTTVEDMLNEAVLKGKESIKTLIDNVVGAALARKKAKELEAQERLVRKTTSNRTKKPEKFVDCGEKNPAKRELFIVEGDSAKESCKLARDGSFQAILPIKGKIINCLKASIEDILGDNSTAKDSKKGNQEVLDILSLLGTGVDLGTNSDLFDINKLKFNKIIICTDGDVDGFQIRVLLYTVFYRLTPQLLRDGYVYVAETPLFELVTNKGIYFAYSVEEKDKMVAEFPSKGIVIKQINRSKGLGENDPDMMWDTTMNPETRRLVKLDIDPREQVVRDISNMLFGLDPHKERKDFIFEMLGQGLQDLVDTMEGLAIEDETLI